MNFEGILGFFVILIISSLGISAKSYKKEEPNIDDKKPSSSVVVKPSKEVKPPRTKITITPPTSVKPK